ncbi:MAG: choice-of-anchor D domain-containing protein [Acidobacteriaceae bacterium]|nr:choice-of-anchor D domain-containing protein [Acidobacteriaceae bacterium]MBV9778536.1 choice-of-anchor D domain-containing protein [Acidobacteriaceae bacterium]
MSFRPLLTLVLPLALSASTPDIISTFAGGGPNNVPATQANVPYPENTAVDKAGNFYVVIGGLNANDTIDRVFRIDTSGNLTVLAGNGQSGYSGDGGPATRAEFSNSTAIAVDSSGNAYIADTFTCIIRKVTASTGIISRFAGTPNHCGYAGDGGAATDAQLSNPVGIALDASGNLYIADQYNNRIRKVTATTGKISTVAGNGIQSYSGDGGAAIDASLSIPYSVAVDASGNLYIADQFNFRIRKVTASTGKISTIAGNGTSGYSGDGGTATSAEISMVYGIASDASGRVFIADTENCVVREVNTKGIIKTVAGTPLSCGYAGDDGKAVDAVLNSPSGLAVDGSDNMYIADNGNSRIRGAAVGGTIKTVAGNGLLNYAAGVSATGASFYLPNSVTSDAVGNIYIADTNNCVVRKVEASTRDIATIAGIPGICGYSGDDEPATQAELNFPAKAIADSSGNIYISDTNNCVVRKITASTGDISTFAGTPKSCAYGGDGGPAASAQLNDPFGITFDSSGNVYIADYVNDVVREVIAATGIIKTVAGNFAKGTGYSGDGGSATTAQLNGPEDVAVDALGDLYIADTFNARVRVVYPSGVIDTLAGNGTADYESDGVPADQTPLDPPLGLAVDAAGDVLIATGLRIRSVDGQGIIYTVAGDDAYGFSGDGGPATSAELADPQGVGIDPFGNIYVADTFNYLVRKVTPLPNVNSSAYNLSFQEQPVDTTSEPYQITLTGANGATINNITITGDFTEADDCPVSLTSGSNCNVDITFTPSAAGARTGTLVISTNGFFNPTVTVNLKGTGEGLTYAPAALNFGDESVGKVSSPHTITFTNDSKTSVKFSSVTITRTTFTVASNTCSGSLAAGKTCKIGVTFKPSGTGTETATLVVKDSDSSSPQLIPLRGTGVTAAGR